MFELVNLEEEENFIRNALIGKIVALSLVINIRLFNTLVLGLIRNSCCSEGDDKF